MTVHILWFQSPRRSPFLGRRGLICCQQGKRELVCRRVVSPSYRGLSSTGRWLQSSLDKSVKTRRWLQLPPYSRHVSSHRSALVLQYPKAVVSLSFCCPIQPFSLRNQRRFWQICCDSRCPKDRRWSKVSFSVKFFFSNSKNNVRVSIRSAEQPICILLDQTRLSNPSLSDDQDFI